MPKRFWLAIALAAAAALMGCGEQPYPVFAVQVASAAQPAALAGTHPSGAAGAAPKSGPGAAAGARATRLSPPAGQEVKKARRGPAKHALPWALNLAPAADLAKLPGMDTVTLQRILQGRPYASKRDLLRRHVLNPAQYAHWKDALVVHRSWQAGMGKQARGEVPTRP